MNTSIESMQQELCANRADQALGQIEVQLPGAGFKYSTDELFWLAAMPVLAGPTLRIFRCAVGP